MLKEKEHKCIRREERENMQRKACGVKKKVISGRQETWPRRGRKEKWPGRCWQCCHRHFGGSGGKRHDRLLCDSTKKWLSKQAKKKKNDKEEKKVKRYKKLASVR